jgi:hypothetical protein
MVMKRLFLVLGAVALCAIAVPARADLNYYFAFNDAQATYSAPTMTMTIISGTSGLLTQAATSALSNPVLSGQFSLSMKISNPLDLSSDPYDLGKFASGSDGTFTFVDADSTTVTGEFKGSWSRYNVNPNEDNFIGVVSNVTRTGDQWFAGATSGVVNTSLLGTVGQLSIRMTGPWFDPGTGFPVAGAQVNATISAVPVPGAVLLGFLGLSAAGLKLRKFV